MSQSLRWKTIIAAIEGSSSARGRAASGKFSVEGFRLIERALAAGACVESVVVGEGLRLSGQGEEPRMQRLLERLEEGGVEVVEAPESALRRVIYSYETGAIAALIKLPDPIQLREAIRQTGACRLLVAVDVDDPGNLGALVRTALASGAQAFLITGPGDPYHPRAVRTSRGSVFRIPVIRFTSETELLQELKACDVETVAAVTSGGRCLSALQPPPEARWAICMGSEAFGLSEGMVGAMDYSVSIPMAGDVDSYSVNAAAAILLYTL